MQRNCVGAGERFERARRRRNRRRRAAFLEEAKGMVFHSVLSLIFFCVCFALTMLFNVATGNFRLSMAAGTVIGFVVLFYVMRKTGDWE